MKRIIFQPLFIILVRGSHKTSEDSVPLYLPKEITVRKAKKHLIGHR